MNITWNISQLDCVPQAPEGQNYVITLSPHNFELIPEGPSEDMAWSYYSERGGRRINIDMLKVIRLLEKLSGEQLVHEA